MIEERGRSERGGVDCAPNGYDGGFVNDLTTTFRRRGRDERRGPEEDLPARPGGRRRRQELSRRR